MQKLKFLLALLFLSGTLAFGQSDRFPKPTGKLISDFADILTPGEEQQLEQKLLRYSDTTSTEIAVVTIQSLNDEDINLYAAELGEEWGVGRKGKDNGLVFLVAPNEREVAIQNGYGLEPVLTDAYTKIIIENYVLPHFRKDDYYGGINEGTDQIIKLLEGEFKGKPNRKGDKRFPAFLPVVIILVILYMLFGRRGRGGRGGYRGGGGYWIGGLGGGSLGGGSSGGFGGGGFGGFGGGSFGGGGASGSW